MTDTRDIVTVWGLAIIALLAIAEGSDRFGPYGIAAVILLLLYPAHRVMIWWEDSQRLQRQEEEYRKALSK
jgi:hypothetical protein